METVNFPKMENQSQLIHEWLFLEDNFHLQRSLDVPLFSKNCQLEYPTTVCSHQLSHNNLEKFGADFHLWNEFPPLLCEDDAWQPLAQLPPLPYIDNPKLNSFDTDEFLLTNTNINDDQLLSMVVAEGLNMPKQCKGSMEEKIIVNGDYDEDDGIRRIKGNNYSKATKIESISYEEIRKYFDMPISRAAKELNVGLTILKKRCRELSIKRWPHRKIKSLEALICNLKEQGMMEMVTTLEEYKRKLQFMPGLELSADTKKLRQACFKANYKKRRALALTHL